VHDAQDKAYWLKEDTFSEFKRSASKPAASIDQHKTGCKVGEEPQPVAGRVLPVDDDLQRQQQEHMPCRL
jgi:hypothetical protein